MTRIDVLGVGFDPVDMDAAVESATSLVTRPAPALIVTANVEMVMRARRTPDLRDILRRASLVVADGVGVVWGARQLGRPLPGRVPGIDLAARLCGEATRRRWRIFLLGGLPGVAAAAAERLRISCPGIAIAGVAHGYASGEEAEREVIRAIREASPTLLLAGLGSPHQERWLDRHLDRLGARAALGIGGTLDVWAGRVPRAPRFMRTAGMEWAYRLIREPSRAGRQLAIPEFIAAILLRRLTGFSRSHR